MTDLTNPSSASVKAGVVTVPLFLMIGTYLLYKCMKQESTLMLIGGIALIIAALFVIKGTLKLDLKIKENDFSPPRGNMKEVISGTLKRIELVDRRFNTWKTKTGRKGLWSMQKEYSKDHYQ